MANQQPNQRFDPFAGAHGQFGNNTGLNQRQQKLVTDKPNAKMEMDLNHEYLQGMDKNANPAGGEFFMNAGLGNPGLGFDANYLNYLPNNFGNGGQIAQNPYAGGNMTDTSNLFLTGNNPSNPNPGNFLLQNSFGLSGLGTDPASVGFYEGLVKNNPNEFWMQGGNQVFMNGANLGELENQLLLNGLDDFSLKQNLNDVGGNLGMLGGANKMLQGLPQLGGLGNMQNPMLMNNFYGLGDHQNLNMLLPGIEDLYQLQLQNSNQPGQLNAGQLNAGQMNPGQLSKLNSNQFNLPSMNDAMLGKPSHNLMPNLKIENTLPSTGNFDGRALNDAQNPYAKMGAAGGFNQNAAVQAGGAAGMNPNNMPGASASQAGMSQYMNNLNKNYPGADLDGGNMQKYLPFLLNSGGNNIQDLMGSMDQRMAAGNAAQGNPGSTQNPSAGNAGAFNFQGNYNAALERGMNPGMMSEDNQKQLGQFLTMNQLKSNSNPKPPGHGSDLDMIKLNSESWLGNTGMKRDPLFFTPTAETYSKWRERAKYERTLKIEKYKNKKRIWSKKISYDCRKRVADTRLRIKGRFISKKDSEKINQLVGGKPEEAFNDKKNLNLDYIIEKFNLKHESGDNGLDAIANRSNISKKELLKKIDDLLNNSNGAIDANSLVDLQLPPDARVSQVLSALRQTANSKMVEEKIAEKLINKKKIFKILYKKIRRSKPSGLDQKGSVPSKEFIKGATPSKNGPLGQNGDAPAELSQKQPSFELGNGEAKGNSNGYMNHAGNQPMMQSNSMEAGREGVQGGEIPMMNQTHNEQGAPLQQALYNQQLAFQQQSTIPAPLNKDTKGKDLEEEDEEDEEEEEEDIEEEEEEMEEEEDEGPSAEEHAIGANNQPLPQQPQQIPQSMPNNELQQFQQALMMQQQQFFQQQQQSGGDMQYDQAAYIQLLQQQYAQLQQLQNLQNMMPANPNDSAPQNIPQQNIPQPQAQEEVPAVENVEWKAQENQDNNANGNDKQNEEAGSNKDPFELVDEQAQENANP